MSLLTAARTCSQQQQGPVSRVGAGGPAHADMRARSAQVYRVDGAVPGQHYDVWVEADAGAGSVMVGLGSGAAMTPAPSPPTCWGASSHVLGPACKCHAELELLTRCHMRF